MGSFIPLTKWIGVKTAKDTVTSYECVHLWETECVCLCACELCMALLGASCEAIINTMVWLAMQKSGHRVPKETEGEWKDGNKTGKQSSPSVSTVLLRLNLFCVFSRHFKHCFKSVFFSLWTAQCHNLRCSHANAQLHITEHMHDVIEQSNADLWHSTIQGIVIGSSNHLHTYTVMAMPLGAIWASASCLRTLWH